MPPVDPQDRAVLEAIASLTASGAAIDSHDVRAFTGLPAARVRESVQRLRWAGRVAFDRLEVSESELRWARPAGAVVVKAATAEAQAQTAATIDPEPAGGSVSDVVAARPAFRSWVEDIDFSRTVELPVDRAAFAVRARQRGLTTAATTNLASMNPWQRTAFENAEARRQADAHRASDPIEQARLFLQRRGFPVYRADVVGGRADRWAMAGRGKDVTDEQLVGIATSKGWVA